jgi:hypothetical protein
MPASKRSHLVNVFLPVALTGFFIAMAFGCAHRGEYVGVLFNTVMATIVFVVPYVTFDRDYCPAAELNAASLEADLSEHRASVQLANAAYLRQAMLKAKGLLETGDGDGGLQTISHALDDDLASRWNDLVNGLVARSKLMRKAA